MPFNYKFSFCNILLTILCIVSLWINYVVLGYLLVNHRTEILDFMVYYGFEIKEVNSFFWYSSVILSQIIMHLIDFDGAVGSLITGAITLWSLKQGIVEICYSSLVGNCEEVVLKNILSMTIVWVSLCIGAFEDDTGEVKECLEV